MNRIGPNANMEIIVYNDKTFVIVCCDDCLPHVSLAMEMIKMEAGENKPTLQ